jgi:hypothetical protein
MIDPRGYNQGKHKSKRYHKRMSSILIAHEMRGWKALLIMVIGIVIGYVLGGAFQ